PMALRREARLLQELDEAGQLPERHRLGRAEAVPDLLDGELRRDRRRLERLAAAVEPPPDAVEEAPPAGLEPRLLGVHARGEAVDAAEEEEGDALDRGLVRRGALGMQEDVIAL